MLYLAVKIFNEYRRDAEWDRVTQDSFTFVNWVRKRTGQGVLSYTEYKEREGFYIQDAQEAAEYHGLQR